MRYMSQNFRLFHVSNLSVRNVRIFLLMYSALESGGSLGTTVSHYVGDCSPPLARGPVSDETGSFQRVTGVRLSDPVRQRCRLDLPTTRRCESDIAQCHVHIAYDIPYVYRIHCMAYPRPTRMRFACVALRSVTMRPCIYVDAS